MLTIFKELIVSTPQGHGSHDNVHALIIPFDPQKCFPRIKDCSIKHSWCALLGAVHEIE